MIGEGDRVLLVGEGREFFTRAGPGKLSTDKGQIELARPCRYRARHYNYHPHWGAVRGSDT